MTKREKLLLHLLVATTFAAVGLWGAQTVLDEWSRLDQRFVVLQRQANQLQLQLAPGAEAPTTKRPSRSVMLWNKGELPDPLLLARKIRPALDVQPIGIQDFQVLTTEPGEFWLRYQLKGSASVVLTTLNTLLEGDPYLLTRRFAARIQEDRTYFFDWEVGYASVP